MNISKIITLVRHASTAHNENGLWQGRSDYPLNEKGRKEAQLLAIQLKDTTFDIIFHSPMKRAIQTAEIINKYHNTTFKTIPSFVEINLGDFDGMKHHDVIKKHPEIHRDWIMDIDVPIPGGESFNDVFDRIKPGVDEVLQSTHRNILVVAHAMVNRAILGQMINMDPIPSRKFRMDNGAFSRFFVYETPHGRHIAVDSWNNVAHIKE
ncbi:MAG: histidine phosphatase family protein [bacterium]|nr:histidine phosphatase family protein [bacterium]